MNNRQFLLLQIFNVIKSHRNTQQSVSQLILKTVFKFNCSLGKNFQLIIIYFKINSMGSCQFEVPRHVQEEWGEWMLRGKKVFKNKITHQCFQFFVLSKEQEAENAQKLIERSLYSLPKTPKVILLNDQRGETSLLVQDAYYTLGQFLPQVQLLTDLLELLEKMIEVVSFLVKKYGYFQVKESMLGINKNSDVMGWCNQDKFKNNPQFPLENKSNAHQAMYQEILNIFKKYSKFTLDKQIQTLCFGSFEEILTELRTFIQLKKKQGTPILLPLQNSLRTKRAASPQNMLERFKTGQFKSPAKIDSINPEKKGNVPRFIKGVTLKKGGLLDSLKHKRTCTIEEADFFPQTRDNQADMMKKNENCNVYNSLKGATSLKFIPNKDCSDEQSNNSYLASIGDKMTSSGSSTKNCPLTIRKFNDFKGIKNNSDRIERQRKQQKAEYQKQPLEMNIKQSYWREDIESCLFESFQKVLGQGNNLLSLQENRSLSQLCPSLAKSNYIDDINNQTEQQSKANSQNLEDQLQQAYTKFFMNKTKEVAQKRGRITQLKKIKDF